MSSTTEESHVSNISHKVYMSKTVVCCACTTSTVIIVFYLCMVTMCTRASVYKKCSYSIIHSFIHFVWPHSFWCRAIHIDCSISPPGPKVVAMLPNVSMKCAELHSSSAVTYSMCYYFYL